MSITEEQVRHVALLARLELSDAHVARFAQDLNSILEHLDAIQRLDLTDVPPTAHALDVVNATRADVRRPCLAREEALANAPEAADGAFVVPRILGGGDEP
ncbi:MAG TPA: Asp-tRNA(Asn)/Glu-tRNA(Gln) amidotransferase subunit GatC [Coriobacteriia bacterium]|nr:Asp-tRNA(Asn)/Glu-tRNA(Gln) amidotransferase subunit GatC [Coriobacteriia bacterium]